LNYTRGFNLLWEPGSHSVKFHTEAA